MAKRDCPECGNPTDTRGLISHLAHEHYGGDYEVARETVESMDSDDESTDETPTDTEPEPESEPDADRVEQEQRDAPDDSGDLGAADGEAYAEGREPSPEPDDTTRRSQESADGGTDEITVETEGSQKLTPDSETDGSNSRSIDPPPGAPEDATPDDYEPGPERKDHRDYRDSEPEHRTETTEESGSSSGGLRDKLGLGGGTDTRDTEEIIEDADTDRERDRRKRVADEIDRSLSEPREERGEEPTEEPDTETTDAGLVVDKDLVAHLINQPFQQMDNVSEWDGWALSKEEREANAELLAAVMDKRGYQPGPESMLMINLLMVVGGRVTAYTAWRRNQEPELEESGDTEAEPTEEQTTEPREEQTETTEPEPEETSDGGYDPTDPETW